MKENKKGDATQGSAKKRQRTHKLFYKDRVLSQDSLHIAKIEFCPKVALHSPPSLPPPSLLPPSLFTTQLRLAPPPLTQTPQGPPPIRVALKQTKSRRSTICEKCRRHPHARCHQLLSSSTDCGQGRFAEGVEVLQGMR